MEENGYRFGVGVLVLASALVGVLLVVFFGAVPSFWVEKYTVTINFEAAPGIDTDTPVKKNGVQIGRVVDVNLLLDNGGVDLRLELEKKYQIAQGELCRIGPGSLITKSAEVEFIRPTQQSLIARFDGKAGSPPNGSLEAEESQIANSIIKDRDYLPGGVVAVDPMSAIVDIQSSIATTASSIEKAAIGVADLSRKVQDLVSGSGDDVQDIVKETKLAINSVRGTSDSIQRVLQQVENSPMSSAVGKLVEQLPGIIQEVEGVVKQSRATLRSFELVGENFQEVGETANRTVMNVEEFTSPLKGEGKRVVEESLATLAKLDGLVAELRTFSKRLNDGDGTISRLIDDPTAYYTLVRTLENVENTTSGLRPIIANVRTFTDKISRDPSQIVGIKSIINGQPAGMGFR